MYSSQIMIVCEQCNGKFGVYRQPSGCRRRFCEECYTQRQREQQKERRKLLKKKE